MGIEWLVLGGAAFFAGFVDAMVGGGGLIQVPALFSVMPGSVPATLLGTNKLASIWGTMVAAQNYLRTVRIRPALLLSGALAAFVCSFFGAWLVTIVPPTYLRKALPFVLGAVALYTFVKKDLGVNDKPRFAGRQEILLAVAVAAVIGFYDGFFGPGTGSFFVFCFVRFFGYDFLRASAVSKVLNVATNASALLLFGVSGHVIWALGALMAACQVGGSLLGSRLAIRHGSGFVRKIFLLVVVCLIIKTSYDAFFR